VVVDYARFGSDGRVLGVEDRRGQRGHAGPPWLDDAPFDASDPASTGGAPSPSGW